MLSVGAIARSCMAPRFQHWIEAQAPIIPKPAAAGILARCAGRFCWRRALSPLPRGCFCSFQRAICPLARGHISPLRGGLLARARAGCPLARGIFSPLPSPRWGETQAGHRPPVPPNRTRRGFRSVRGACLLYGHALLCHLRYYFPGCAGNCSAYAGVLIDQNGALGSPKLSFWGLQGGDTPLRSPPWGGAGG